ncbi:uncharacterized protein [Vicugna pacos]|uniref:Translation initiation factor IF-2-like n=1 Tax=Vicugna pacos TaxID=30538 RepID=A0ABM5DNI9_VICPA
MGSKITACPLGPHLGHCNAAVTAAIIYRAYLKQQDSLPLALPRRTGDRPQPRESDACAVSESRPRSPGSSGFPRRSPRPAAPPQPGVCASSPASLQPRFLRGRPGSPVVQGAWQRVRKLRPLPEARTLGVGWKKAAAAAARASEAPWVCAPLHPGPATGRRGRRRSRFPSAPRLVSGCHDVQPGKDHGKGEPDGGKAALITGPGVDCPVHSDFSEPSHSYRFGCWLSLGTVRGSPQDNFQQALIFYSPLRGAPRGHRGSPCWGTWQQHDRDLGTCGGATTTTRASASTLA